MPNRPFRITYTVISQNVSYNSFIFSLPKTQEKRKEMMIQKSTIMNTVHKHLSMHTHMQTDDHTHKLSQKHTQHNHVHTSVTIKLLPKSFVRMALYSFFCRALRPWYSTTSDLSGRSLSTFSFFLLKR